MSKCFTSILCAADIAKGYGEAPTAKRKSGAEE